MERAHFLYDCVSAWPRSAVHVCLDMWLDCLCVHTMQMRHHHFGRWGPLCSLVNRLTRSDKPQHTAALPGGPDILEVPPPIWNSQLTTCIASNSQMAQAEKDQKVQSKTL